MKLLKETLSDTINHLGIKEKLKEQKIVAEWESIVGKKLAEVCLPKEIKNGIIFIECPSPVWMQELIFRKRDIKNRINNKLGYKICKDVKIVTGNSVKSKLKQREDNDNKELFNLDLVSLKESEREWIEGTISDKNLEDDIAEKIKKIIEKDVKLKKQKKLFDYITCKECGRHMVKNRDVCIICKSYFTTKRMRSIINLLKDVPWLNKGELEKYFPNLTSKEYNRAKKKARDEAVDEVYRSYFAYKNINSEENLQWLKDSLNDYVFVISETKPGNIDNSIREKKIKSLNENIYKIIYKKE